MRPNGNRPPGDPGRAALFPPTQPKRSVLLATTRGGAARRLASGCGMAGGTGMSTHGGAWAAAWAGTRPAGRTAMVVAAMVRPLALLALAALTLKALPLQAVVLQAITVAERLSARHRRANGTQRQHEGRDGETASEHFLTLPG